MKKINHVSIIIPVFNVSSYLDEALDSAIHQSYQNLEIILVDDGSTDGSEIICDEYAKNDTRIKVIHQENMGLSAARNTGLGVMTGEAVAFLDSDDALAPDYVKAMVDAMNREDANIVICRFTIHRTMNQMKAGEKAKVYPAVKNGKLDRNGALRALVDGTINPGVWNKLYRKELWEKVRFPVGHVYENVDTTFRVFDQCDKTVVLDRSLYLYRKRLGAITEDPSKRNIDDWLLARSHFKAYIRDNIPEIFKEEDLKRFYRSRINQMIRFYCVLSRSKEAGETEWINNFRKQIIKTASMADIEKCGLFTRAGIQIMIFCPSLLKTVYPVFSRLYLSR